MSELVWKDFDTLESHISKQQKLHPSSRGTFSNILRRIGVATKIISAKVQKAGLIDVLGIKGTVNIQGEVQVKLDDIANSILRAAFHTMPSIVGMATEEEEDFTAFATDPHFDGSRYLVMFDPLDGSSNVDANVSVGTIFAIQKFDDHPEAPLTKEHFFKTGRQLCAAGYVIYGSSNMFVYSTGQGVHGFTLDPEIGEYVLSHEDITIPNSCKCFSANESHYNQWDKATQVFADHLRFSDDPQYKSVSSRYIGSLVSDFHRNLLYGGIYMYPENALTKKSKLRLLYECAPLAFLAEQAGGQATDGINHILDLVPSELHQRVPLIIGNKKEVEFYKFLKQQYY